MDAIWPAALFALLVGAGIGAMLGYRQGFTRGANFTSWIDRKMREPPVIAVGDIIQEISDANPAREPGNLIRRLVKIVEELGEASEAYLNVTSAANGKKKTWDDVREELADVVIVAVDCALTPMPDQIEAGASREDVAESFAAEVSRKLAKWRRNRDTGKAATDAE